MKLVPALFIFYCCLLNACHTIYKADPRKSAATRLLITPSDSLLHKQQKGIDFFSEGNTPVPWTLELDFAKGFSFKSSGSGLLIASPAAVIRLANGDSYVSKTDSGEMKVMIYNEACVNNGNTKNAARKTEVTINNKRYSGCGSYLYDSQLNDIWDLESIDNKSPGDSAYKGQVPWLALDLQKKEMHGYDGCNNISSGISVEGDRIIFSSFTGAKTSCINNETEKIFSTLVSAHTIDYFVKDARLTLTLIDERRLVFKRRD